MKLLLFDTETTGKDIPRIVQFAYMRIDSQTMKEEARKSFLCKPAVPIELGAMAVHGITNEAVAGEPPFTHFAVPVQSLVSTHIVVAHNAKFDLGALKNESIDTEYVPHICTYKLAVHLFPDFENHQLQYLRYALGVDCPEFHALRAHDAMADVLVLEKVFYALLWKYIETMDTQELEEQAVNDAIGKMVEHSRLPIIYPKIRFGKYKGRTFEEIKLRDTSYLDWLYDSETRKPSDQRDENLLYTIETLLRK